MEYSTAQVENVTKVAFECSDMSEFTLRQKLVLQIPCYSCFLFLGRLLSKVPLYTSVNFRGEFTVISQDIYMDLKILVLS